MSTLTHLRFKKYYRARPGKNRSVVLPFIVLTVAIKISGLLAISLIILTILTQHQVTNVQTGLIFPEIDLKLMRGFIPLMAQNEVPVSTIDEKIVTLTRSTDLFSSILATVTPMVNVTPSAPIVPDVSTKEIIIPTNTHTLHPQPTNTYTATIIPTGTMTATETLTPTLSPTTTATPHTSDYGGKMNSPMAGISFIELQSIISQPFKRLIEARDIGHYGVDLGSYDYKGKIIYNWPVASVFAGKVVSIGKDRLPLGNKIIIETSYKDIPPQVISLLEIEPGESIYHLYGHMVEAPKFEIGDHIECGQIIGAVGNSSTVEAHLHLEMRIGTPNVEFDGMVYYETGATDQERQNYERFRMSGEFRSIDPMIIFSNLP